MPRTAEEVPLVLPQSVMKTVVPPLTMSSLPDSNPSFIGLPAGNCRQVTFVDSNPACARCFSSSCFCSTSTIASVPMPYWVAICSSATSARGAAADSGDNKIITVKAARAKPALISHLRCALRVCDHRVLCSSSDILTHGLHEITNRTDIFKCPDGADDALDRRPADALLSIGPHFALDLRSGEPVIG